MTYAFEIQNVASACVRDMVLNVHLGLAAVASLAGCMSFWDILEERLGFCAYTSLRFAYVCRYFSIWVLTYQISVILCQLPSWICALHHTQVSARGSLTLLALRKDQVRLLLPLPVLVPLQPETYLFAPFGLTLRQLVPAEQPYFIFDVMVLVLLHGAAPDLGGLSAVAFALIAYAWSLGVVIVYLDVDWHVWRVDVSFLDDEFVYGAVARLLPGSDRLMGHVVIGFKHRLIWSFCDLCRGWFAAEISGSVITYFL